MWSLNNFLIGDPSLAVNCIEFGILKTLVNVFEKIKTKTEDLISEALWMIFYLTNANDDCIDVMLSQLPTLPQRLTQELDSNSLGSINRPILRTLGNLLTRDQNLGHNLMYDEKFQTFIL